MEIPEIVWIAGGVAILVVIGVCVLVVLTRSKSSGEEPGWMRGTLPPETVAATQADGEGITLYDYDVGERVAAPFAEQIEDILRARLSADPALAAIDVDLGTAPDGGLEIWVDGVCYTDVNLLPDERLRQTFLQVVKEWDAAE